MVSPSLDDHGRGWLWRDDGLAGRRNGRSWLLSRSQSVRIIPNQIAEFLLPARWTDDVAIKGPEEHCKRRQNGSENEPPLPPGRLIVQVGAQAEPVVGCLLGEGQGGEDVGGAIVGAVARRIAVSELLQGGRGTDATLAACSELGIVVGPAVRVHQDQASASQFGQDLLRLVAVRADLMLTHFAIRRRAA